LRAAPSPCDSTATPEDLKKTALNLSSPSGGRSRGRGRTRSGWPRPRAPAPHLRAQRRWLRPRAAF
jgi:hypothetical protein